MLLLLVGCGFATGAAGEDYDFQVGLTYGWAQLDSTSVSTLGGVPDPSLGTTTTSSDSDDIGLSGAWYYSGLSDANGPKSRASFMSRASGFFVSYSRGDESTTTEFSGGGIIPPQTVRSDGTSTEVSLDFRHVWKDSGWYALAGASRSELDVDIMLSGGEPAFVKFDANGYRLGVGKYIGKATSLDLAITTLDVGSSNPTVVALSFSHIGSIGANWQYGADVTFAKSDTGGDGDAFALRGALFPSESIEFGLVFARQEPNDGFEVDTIEVFGGWFVRDNVEVTALYRLDDPDTFPGQDVDSDEFGVGVAVRF
ncbi:MAG: hypothetical protein OER91_13480 [Gammaproteobacteria bacterium]|nr:hypothetical protein [Gammaproteobacteria bacterium]